jgi:prepilin-type N-terminal cleavage/methylation domain-containing protein
MERLQDERGFTLVELLLCSALMAFVLAAFLGLLDQTAGVSARDNQRGHALREVEVGMESLVREARHAYRIGPTSTATVLRLQAKVQGRDREVVFDCSKASATRAGAKQCERTEIGGTTTQVVVDHVYNGDVFAYRPNAAAAEYVTVKLQVRAGGTRSDGPQHHLVITDGFSVRNHGVLP